MITAVTTCMGRLEHLEITLPLMLEEFDDVIVVDWSCPDKSGEYSAALGARIAYRPGERYFERSAARNFGAELCESEFIAFIDADTMCMPGLGDELRLMIRRKDSMVLASRTAQNYDIPNLFGFVACPTVSFRNVGGYDESYKGWGHEDSKLRGQLFLEARLKPARLSPMALGAIAHGNEIRAKNHEQDVYTSSVINFKKLNAYFDSHGVQNWMTDPRTADITFRCNPDDPR